MKFTDIPNFPRNFFEADGAFHDERDLLDVLDALPDDVVEFAEKYWSCTRIGHFYEVWQEISWEIAKDILWDGNHIKDEKLACLIIAKALPIYMVNESGYNSVSSKENIPEAVRNDTYMTQMDYLVICALAYAIEEAFSLQAVTHYFCKRMMENYYEKHLEKSLSTFPRKQFEELLRRKALDGSDCFDAFAEKAEQLVRELSVPKKVSVELKIPGSLDAKEILKEVQSNFKAMGKDFDFVINAQ